MGTVGIREDGDRGRILSKAENENMGVDHFKW
jgi:hypothetical protein